MFNPLSLITKSVTVSSFNKAKEMKGKERKRKVRKGGCAAQVQSKVKIPSTVMEEHKT